MLRIIYGRAGSGKTSFCFNEIKDKIKNSEKIYIITPEQFSYTAEKHLMEIIDEKANMNAEILTFDRMAYRVFQEIGGSKRVALSDCGIAMLLYDILDKEKKKLTFLGKTSKNVNVVSRLFTELNKHKVEDSKIKELIENTEDTYLKLKLKDILILREALRNRMPSNYMENTNKLNLLAEKLEYSNMFNDAIIYLDEFAGFTKQEYDIIENILKKAKQVNVTVCTDCIEYESNIETDIFYENKQTAVKLIELAKKVDVGVEPSVQLKTSFRFKSSEIAHLEQNIFNLDYEKYEKDAENLELFLAMNPYSEIEYIAQKIVYLVRENNFRYRDIAVITKNIDCYSTIASTVFKQYDIPVFIDQKRDLNSNILVQFLLAIFDIIIKNWSYEAVFNYLKTGLTRN